MQLVGSAGWVEGAGAVCGCELRTGNVAESDGEAERAGELDDSVQALVREEVFGNVGLPNSPVGQRPSSIWSTFGRDSLESIAGDATLHLGWILHLRGGGAYRRY